LYYIREKAAGEVRRQLSNMRKVAAVVPDESEMEPEEAREEKKAE
jgi:hypothetical protein